jgi:hypothetical protein
VCAADVECGPCGDLWNQRCARLLSRRGGDLLGHDGPFELRARRVSFCKKRGDVRVFTEVVERRVRWFSHLYGGVNGVPHESVEFRSSHGRVAL